MPRLIVFYNDFCLKQCFEITFENKAHSKEFWVDTCDLPKAIIKKVQKYKIEEILISRTAFPDWFFQELQTAAAEAGIDFDNLNIKFL